MTFPIQRLRRLRKTEVLRSMVRETHLRPSNLIMPLFVCPGRDVCVSIPSMPGNSRMSADRIAEYCKEIQDAGVPAVLLFGIPESKDPTGTSGYTPDGVVQTAVREIKKSCPELAVITDVCLCEYTNHGHCGVLKGHDVDNDQTLPLLQKMALSHAEAGADIVAPSDMMDGRIGAIRQCLDSNGFHDTIILAYAAKFASAFYGPFRDAADSAPAFGDRRSYQMDPANGDEAMREIALDLEEGADMIMVKPGLPYLDIIWRAKQTFNAPLAAYNVSGEFSMIKAAGERGWLDEERAMMESLVCLKRAGADLIITYYALEAAKKISA